MGSITAKVAPRDASDFRCRHSAAVADRGPGRLRSTSENAGSGCSVRRSMGRWLRGYGRSQAPDAGRADQCDLRELIVRPADEPDFTVRFQFNRHAKNRMREHGITEQEIQDCIARPLRTAPSIKGRTNYFSAFRNGTVKITAREERRVMVVITVTFIPGRRGRRPRGLRRRRG